MGIKLPYGHITTSGICPRSHVSPLSGSVAVGEWQMDRWTDGQSSVPPTPTLSALHLGLPGGGGQCNEQSLEDTADEDDGVLPGDEEVQQGQDEETVDHQPANHGHGVEAQLFPHCLGVIHLQDLASDQEDNAKGEVPGVAEWPQVQFRVLSHLAPWHRVISSQTPHGSRGLGETEVFS